MLKVAKFGGTSVADSLQIEKIKSIVEADGDRRYIVMCLGLKFLPHWHPIHHKC